MQLPTQTSVIVRTSVEERVTNYVAFVLGPSRWGIRVSIPQILNQTYTLPTRMTVKICFVLNNKYMECDSYVMGYEQTVPPCMVLAEPQVVHEANRRNYLRLHKAVPVSYLADGDEVLAERTQTHDLSLGGLSMVTRTVLPRGTPISLTLTLPDQSLTISAQVAWSGFRGRMALTGVEFAKLSEANAKSLSKYLQTIERELRTV